MENYRFFVGTYTQPIRFGTGQLLKGKGAGIYSVLLSSGEARVEGIAAETENPSYLTLSPDRKTLFAVNECKEWNGLDSGGVCSFQTQKGNRLRFLNSRATGGQDPCHVVTSRSGKYLFVSNFMSGSVAVFPISADGSLAPCCCFHQHTGRGYDSKRQAGPHAHSLILSKEERFAVVPDLGLDCLMVYEWCEREGTLTKREDRTVQLRAGSGPRHLVFHPRENGCYLINELASSVTRFLFDEKEGIFSPLQTVSTLSQTFQGDNICAHIQLSPSGRFLYVSNRGENSLVTYRLKKETREMELVGRCFSGGETPRHFTITADGKWLLAANQDSDGISVFAVDPLTGLLEQSAWLPIPTPVCMIEA